MSNAYAESNWGWDEEEVLANIPKEDDDRREETVEIDLSLTAESLSEEPDLDNEDVERFYHEYLKLLLEE